MSGTIVEFTTGEPGAGKSYRRCAHFIVNVLLNPNEAGPKGIWCNYPIEFDPWVDKYGVEQPGLIEFIAVKYGEEVADEVEDRVKVFPPEEVASWKPPRKGQPVRGPWSFFEENDIDTGGWHVAIDEIHNFAPKGNRKVEEAWGEWMGEIRHEGLTIEFLTQDPDEVTRKIQGRAGVRRELVRSVERRDPYFKIKLGDWYQFGTIFGQPYRPSCWEVAKRKVMSKWVVSDEMPFWFKPDLYGVYDSHSASNKTNRSGATAELAYQRFGKVRLFFWFFRKNWMRFVFNPTVPRALFIIGLIMLSMNYGRIVAWWTGKQQNKVSQGKVESFEGPSAELPQFESNPALLAVDQAKLELKMLQAEHEVMVERLVRSLDAVDGIDQVLGMAPGVVFLADGRSVSVGDTIDMVTGETKTIKAIDYENRRIEFDTGVELYGSDFGMLDRVSGARTSSAKLREVLSGSGESDTSGAGQGSGPVVRESNAVSFGPGSR